MALKIRLSRAGAHKRPYYKVVVADARSPRDGNFLEKLGTYNPMLASDHQDRLTLKTDRILHWISVGAQPTDRVAKFLGQVGIQPMPTFAPQTKQSQPRAKTQERMKENAAKAEKAAEAAAQALIDSKAAEEAAAQAAAEAVAVEEAEAVAVVEAAMEESITPAEELVIEAAADEPTAVEPAVESETKPA